MEKDYECDQSGGILFWFIQPTQALGEKGLVVVIAVVNKKNFEASERGMDGYIRC